MQPTVTPLRVKEREDPDWCRHCGRPTWSLRRCCVRCKRAGRTGPGTIASRYAPSRSASRLLALLCFGLAHLWATTALFVAASWAVDGARPAVHLLIPAVFAGIFLATLDGLGFAIAAALARRPERRAASRYYALAAGIGVLCAALGLGALYLLENAVNPPSFGYAVLLVLGLSASISQFGLVTAFATGLLREAASQAPQHLCGFCGANLTSSIEPECPTCGEPCVPA